VALRAGGRYLGSAMAWNQPQHLAIFPLTSPFQGRAVGQPGPGTALVTAKQSGGGWIVLFHITASPAWSTLPLSGLYVDMLKRLLALSAGTPAASLAHLSSLAPLSVMDGFGHLQPPAPDISPIAAREFEHTDISV